MADNDAMPLTEIQSNEVKRTRSGRVSLPRLAFWAGERVFTSLNDGDASVYIPPKQSESVDIPYLTPTSFQHPVNQNARSLPAEVKRHTRKTDNLRKSAPTKRNCSRMEDINEKKSKRLKCKPFEEKSSNSVKSKDFKSKKSKQSNSKSLEEKNENINPQKNRRKCVSMENTPVEKNIHANSILSRSHPTTKKNVTWSDTKNSFASTPRNSVFLAAVSNARKLRSTKKAIFNDSNVDNKPNNSLSDIHPVNMSFNDDSKLDNSKNTSINDKMLLQNQQQLSSKQKRLKIQKCLEISPIRAGLSKDFENLTLIDEYQTMGRNIGNDENMRKNIASTPIRSKNISHNSNKNSYVRNLNNSSQMQCSDFEQESTNDVSSMVLDNDSSRNKINTNNNFSRNQLQLENNTKNPSSNSNKFDISLDLFLSDHSTFGKDQLNKKEIPNVSDEDEDHSGFHSINNDFSDSEEDENLNKVESCGVFPNDQDQECISSANSENKCNTSFKKQHADDQEVNRSGRMTRSHSKSNNNLSVRSNEIIRNSKSENSGNMSKDNNRNAEKFSSVQALNLDENKYLQEGSCESSDGDESYISADCSPKRKNLKPLRSRNASLKINGNNEDLSSESDDESSNHRYPKRKTAKPVHYLDKSSQNDSIENLNSASLDESYSPHRHFAKRKTSQNIQFQNHRGKKTQQFADGTQKSNNESNVSKHKNCKVINKESTINKNTKTSVTNSPNLEKISPNSTNRITNNLQQNDKSSPLNLNNFHENMDTNHIEEDVVIIDLFSKTFRNRSTSEADNIRKSLNSENRDSIEQNKNQPFRKPEHLSRNITPCVIADLFKMPNNYKGRRQTVSVFPDRVPKLNVFNNGIQKQKQKSKSCAVVGRFTYPHSSATAAAINNENGFEPGMHKRSTFRKKGSRVSQREALKNKRLLVTKLDRINQAHSDDMYQGVKIPTTQMDTNMTVDNSELSLNFSTPKPKHSPAPGLGKKKVDSSSSDSDVGDVEFTTNRKIADLYLHQREKRNKDKQAKDGASKLKKGLERITEEENPIEPVYKPLSRADIDKAKDTITAMIKKLAMKEPVEASNVSSDELEDYYFDNEED